MAVKILAFAGSTRKESFNKKLIRIAAHAGRNLGAEVTVVDLAEYALPLYDGDLEASGGLPENAKKLKDIFLANQGLLIASPEYNSSISGVLKNTIDWVSRPVAGRPELECFEGKIAGIMSASPGALGGLRGLVTLRSLLSNIKVTVLPMQFALSKAGDAFDGDGLLKEAKQLASVEGLVKKLVEMVGKVHG